jgi:hypothetical protein
MSLLALLAALSACTSSHDRPQSTPGASTQTQDETIQLGAGQSFLPPPTSAHPALSAVGAWRRYARAMHAKINRTNLPPDTFARLGVFIDGGGRHHLTYGYFTPDSPPVYTLEHHSKQPCTRWQMLNADTARHIESSWACPPATIPPND